jgi:hypothetical protein
VTVVVCTECGNETDTDEQFCESCGTYLAWWGERIDGSAETVAEGELQAETNGGSAATALLSMPPGPEAVSRPPRTIRQAWKHNPGDIVCATCARPNPPGGHFCRACGGTLLGAPPLVIPRWRRIVRRTRTWRAGERPGWTRLKAGGPRRIPRRILLLVGAALLAIGLIVACIWLWAVSVGGWARHVANTIRRDAYPYYEPLRPASVRGEPQTKQHPGRAAFDRDLTTFWAAPGRNGIGGRLIVNLKPAADVARLGIFAGDPVGNELVPKDVRLAFFRWDATVKGGWVLMKTAGIRLDNKPGFQFFAQSAKGVGLVIITVRSVYAADTPGVASITEVEFFHKH